MGARLRYVILISMVQECFGAIGVAEVFCLISKYGVKMQIITIEILMSFLVSLLMSLVINPIHSIWGIFNFGKLQKSFMKVGHKPLNVLYLMMNIKIGRASCRERG